MINAEIIIIMHKISEMVTRIFMKNGLKHSDKRFNIPNKDVNIHYQKHSKLISNTLQVLPKTYERR